MPGARLAASGRNQAENRRRAARRARGYASATSESERFMGDVRFQKSYSRVREATNRVAALRTMSDEEVIEALAGASMEKDPLFANFLGTEAVNRLRRARRVLDQLIEGVIATDRAGTIVLLNPSAERMLGWLQDEAAGRPVGEILKVSPAAATEAELSSGPSIDLFGLARSTTVHYPDVIISGKWPSRLFASLTASPLLHYEEFSGVVLSFQDTGAQREAEEQRLQLQALWEGMPDGLIAKTLDGRIASWSPACERIYGYSAAEAVGRAVSELIIVPENAAEEADLFGQVVEGRPIRSRRTLRRRKDGSTVPVVVSQLPVRGASGRVTCVLSIQHPLEPAAAPEGQALA